jgi:hypothetical protein
MFYETLINSKNDEIAMKLIYRNIIAIITGVGIAISPLLLILLVVNLKLPGLIMA